MGYRESAVENMVVAQCFWKDKKVLVTGHTGFKGSWISIWLQSMGAKVIGVALYPPSEKNLFNICNVENGIESHIADIRDLPKIQAIFREAKPDVVIHMAAQSLVRYSYSNPVETYEVNVMGTLNIMEAIRGVDSVSAAVMVTTDKCYRNNEWVYGYREIDPMGGYDPYSSSKGCAELLVDSYRNSFFEAGENKSKHVAIASVRAGNVIGGGDWAEDRLIPDVIRAFENNEEVIIRSPNAIRPWQHVLEPLSGYLILAQEMSNNPGNYNSGWNFGPQDEDVKPVAWLVEKIAELWGKEAKWTIDSANNPHEAHYLKLDCSKARNELGWSPVWSISEALERIVSWHKAEMASSEMRAITEKQIAEYMEAQKLKS